MVAFPLVSLKTQAKRGTLKKPHLLTKQDREHSAFQAANQEGLADNFDTCKKVSLIIPRDGQVVHQLVQGSVHARCIAFCQITTAMLHHLRSIS